MLQWDTLGVRRRYYAAFMMHKIMNNKAPEYLTEVLQPIRDSTAYNLRDSSFKLALQKPNTENLKKIFSYRGAKLWNSLPTRIKAEPSLNVFRKSLRTLGLQDGI